MSQPELILRLVAVAVAVLFLVAAVTVWVKARDDRDGAGCLAFVMLVIAAGLLIAGLSGLGATS